MTAVLATGIGYGIGWLRRPVPLAQSPVPVLAPTQVMTSPAPPPSHRTEIAPSPMKTQGTTGPSTPTAVDSQAGTDSLRSQSRTYSILVGSFRLEPEAASLLSQLSGLGYHVRTARVTSPTRGAWHQVFVGPYGDLEQARADQTRVRQLPGYADAHVVTQ